MTGNLGIGVSPTDSFGFTKALDVGSTGGAFVYVRDTDATNAIGGIGISGTRMYISNKAAGPMTFQVNGDATTRMTIDSSGRVTTPNQPSFGAYQLTGNYTTGSGYHKMILDGVRWNEGSHYSTTNSKFTAPIDGVYHFSAHVNRYSVNDDYYFSILFQVNNAIHTMGSRFHSRGATDLVASMSQTIKLTANDYVEVYSYSNDTSSGFSNGAIWNTFSGFLIG